ncbi:HNH endonuclease [Lentibacillus amyloliquefaciens]|uniref:HNH endonuclease n=1 Tax=Lentibacillus amyloliquefaciens TaxID=1472767 RepID=UPI0009E9BA9E|nr:HNH endonuclease signature motif containing protein [Lentibacillus amyloliquefaciens]
MYKQVNPFYLQKKWKHKRNVILRRDNYECRECKRYGRVMQATTVHHIYPLEEYPEYRLRTHNLISLCGNCHNMMHDRTTNDITPKGEQWQARVRKIVGGVKVKAER